MPSLLGRLFGMLALTSLPAAAQQMFYVNNAGDSGDIAQGVGSGNSGDLRYCLVQAMAHTNAEIVVQTSPVLTKPPRPWVQFSVGSTLVIRADSGTRTISGGNVARIFFFDAWGSNIILRNLNLVNGRAQGGAGGQCAGGGGGLGGAIFVNAGSVYLENVSFSGNTAVGGAGGVAGNSCGGGGGLHGAGGTTGGQGGGGGGGYFGSGGSVGSSGGGSGGGGVFYSGASSSGSFYFGGGGGGTTPAGIGGIRNAGAGGGSGGDEGEETEFVNGLPAVGWGGGGGGGGGGYLVGGGGYDAGRGGNGLAFGGGGGGGGTVNMVANSAGNGGDFGGGGGSGISDASRPGQVIRGGNGGLGGGGGGGRHAGGTGGFGAGNGALNTQAGQAGSGLGGNVFVRSGASVIVRNNTSIGSGTVISGGVGGSAAGEAVYVMQDASLTYDLNGAGTLTMPGIIAGAGGLVMSGPGNTVTELTGANTYSGVTTIQYGTLRVANAAALSPNTVLNIWDYGTFDVYGNPFSLTPARLGGSTGTVTNWRTGVPVTLTIPANGGDIPVSVSLADGSATLALNKTGAGTLRLQGSSTATGGTTVSQGILELAGGNQGGIGTLNGSLTVNSGATVNAVVPNAIGYLPGRKISTATLNGGTFNSPANADQGWGVAWTLHNGAVMSSNNGVNNAATLSKFAFGGPADNRTSLTATGAAASEIRGRVDLRPEFSQTMVDFTVAASASLLVPAVITSAGGPVGLRKLGGGWLKLQGANTYTGNTVVEAGTLELAGTQPANIGTIIGSLTVNNGATVNTSVPDAFGYSDGVKINAVFLNSGSTLHHTASAAANLGWGIAYTLNQGGIMKSNDGVNSATAASKFAFGGPAGSNTSVSVLGTVPSEIRGRIDLRPTNGQTFANFNVDTGAQLNIPAAITSADPGANAVRLRKTGAGTLALSFANTYTGGTEINAGVLAIANNDALSTTGSITFTGGTLRYDGVTPDLSSRLRVSGGQSIRIDTNGQSVTFNNILSGDGNFGKFGSGTLTIAGVSTYTGQTSVNAGTLKVAAGGRLGPGPVNISAGATLDLTSFGGAGYGFAPGTVLTNNGTILGNYYWSGTTVDITVEQPANTGINPNATVAFGTLAVGSSTAKTFTVKNTTAGSLQINSVSISGANASDFILSGTPAFPAWLTPTPGNIPITLTVTFNPATLGAKTATLRIQSNDPDEGTFDITLTGTGETPRELSVELPDGTTLDRMELLAWGLNDQHQTEVTAGLQVRRISGGRWHTLAVKADGTLASWGYNGDGQVSFPAGLSGITAVAAGAYHSMALKADGTVEAWGNNLWGQSTVPAGLTNVRALSAGETFSAALKTDGTVTVWGDNGFGQRTVPAGLAGVTAIAAGAAHMVALKNDASLVMWGSNAKGQTTLPAGLGPVKAIAAGVEHTVAVRLDGTVAAWGGNDGGQCSVPAGLTSVVAVAAGNLHTLALKSDGTVVGWGNNANGRATAPAALLNAGLLAAGWNHNVAANVFTTGLTQDFGSVMVSQSSPARSMVLRNTGTEPLSVSSVSVVGANAADFVLNTAAMPAAMPATIPGLGQISVSLTFTPAAVGSRTASLRIESNDADEGVFTVPLSGTGYLTPEVAVEDPSGNLIPNTINFGSQVSGQQGPLQTFVIKNLGSQPLTLSGPVITGAHAADFVPGTGGMLTSVPGSGQTSFTVRFMPSGSGARTASLRLTTNDADEGTIDISLTGFSAVPGDISVEVPSAGPPVASEVLAWGKNDQGQSNVPAGVTGIRAVSAGRWHVMALQSDDSLIGWGYNGDGQRTVPPGVGACTAVAAGGYHTVALRVDGTVAAWGYNGDGQCSVPAGLTGVIAITAGERHSVALKNDGTVVAWGSNSGGQSTVPPDLTGVSAISAGVAHTLALKSNGTVIAWGLNSSGQTSVPAGLTNVVAIAAGGTHSAALKSDGTVVTWGGNASGQRNLPAGLANVRAIAAGLSHTVVLKQDGTVLVYGSNAFGETTVPSAADSILAIAAGWEYIVAMKGSDLPPFDRTIVGTSSPARTVVIKNRGTEPLTISSVSVMGANPADFSADTAGMLTTVPGLGQTSFILTFTPAAHGLRQAQVRILSNDPDQGTLDLKFFGTGYIPQEIVLENPDGTPFPNSVDFGTVLSGQSSPPRPLVIKNLGSDPLIISSVSATGASPADFPVSTSGTLTAIPGFGQASLTFRFTPVAHGPRAATLRILTGDADEGTLDIALTGIGRFPPSLSLRVDGQTPGIFAPQNVTTTSQPQTVIVKNHGGEPLEITSLTLASGTEGQHFTLDTTGMLTTLAGNSETTFTLTFAPLSGGFHSTVLQVLSNDAVNPALNYPVQGTGLIPRGIWRQIHFGSPDNTGLAADAADWDHDGITNLVEYAFGSDPVQPNGDVFPRTFDLDGWLLAYQFTQPAGTSNIYYFGEWSDDCVNWQPMYDIQGAPDIIVGTDAFFWSNRLFTRLTVMATGP